MFASPSALLQTPVIAPLFLPYRTSKRVRNPELSAELRSSQNTLRWFSQSRLCSALLAYRAEVERALSYTPVFREELTVRNSCAWPATFDSKHVAILGCTSSKTPISGIARGGVISRGFRTKASFARSAYGDADPLKAEDFLRQIDGKKTQPSESKSDRLHAMFQDKNLSAEEQMRLRVAFAEGYRLGPRRKGIQERLGLIGISLVMFYIMFRLVGKVVFKGANEIAPEDVDVKFEDVIGVEEAKQELLEIVDFLKNPKKYSNLGGRLPKGALLVGPPGTGKTLLARAVAGEAGVPFFHASGSEFDEVLVGQGARRMRDLFNNAKERAPCVIFIDEIDSVGAKRSTSTLHPYANQTINQLLSEMDGFRQNEGVIVLGATNRRDDLDKALLRPGRFDVEVQVPKPDVTGRKNLFDYYMSKVKADQSIDLDYLARGTTGFTGADIESMVNQAALKAAIDEQEFVTMEYLLQARDKILMGPEIRSRVPLHEDKVITAYHEGGHALVAYYSKDATPIHKVTIMPRGQSLGHTSFIPSKDELHRNKSQILATIDMAMAGRAAEELMFGSEKVTTGAYSDFQQATQLATAMVKYWGMSDKVGERVFASKQNSLVTVNDVSDQTSELIDEEIKRTLHESMERAKNILRTHERELKLLADALLKYETLDAKEVKQLLETGSLER